MITKLCLQISAWHFSSSSHQTWLFAPTISSCFSAMSCIVCLSPRGVCVQPHLKTSEFVWMSDRPTLPLCSFSGDYNDLMRGWKASTKLSHSLFFVWEKKNFLGGDSLQIKHPSFNTPLFYLVFVNLPISLDQTDKNVWTQTEGFCCWTWKMYFSLVFILYIFLKVLFFMIILFWCRKVRVVMLQNLFIFLFQC